MPELDKSQIENEAAQSADGKTPFVIVVADTDRKHGELLKALMAHKYSVREYSPQDFQSDQSSIQAGTHEFFLGDFPYSKELRTRCSSKFNELGMHYGWLGTQAVGFVDTSLHGPADYRKLLELNKECDDQLAGRHKQAAAEAGISSQEWWDDVMKGADYAAAMVTGKIRDLQYKCVVKKFYLDGLNEFMND